MIKAATFIVTYTAVLGTLSWGLGATPIQTGVISVTTIALERVLNWLDL